MSLNCQIQDLRNAHKHTRERVDKLERKLTAFFEFLDSLSFDADGKVTVTREGIHDLENKLSDIEYSKDDEE